MRSEYWAPMVRVICKVVPSCRLGTALPDVHLSIEQLPKSISLKLPAEISETIGVIAARGDNVTPAYYRQPLRAADVPFLTGDVGFRDSSERLWTLGRASDAFVWEGSAVFPVAVEAVVLQLDQVSRCVLVQVCQHLMQG